MSKESGLLADIVTRTSRLPWWVGLLLAAGSYYGFNLLIGIAVPAASGAADAGPVLIRQLTQWAATVLQYAMPMLCLFGVLMSWLSGRRHKALEDQMASGERAIGELDWREFERLVGAWFEQRGFRVSETASDAAGGVDLYATGDGERVLIQCKHWRARKVGVEPVLELYGVLAACRGARAYVVTAGDFTKAAREFAHGREIQLVDGAELRKALAAKPRAPKPAEGEIATVALSELPQTTPAAPPLVTSVAPSTPPAVTCPKCGAAMLERAARTGARAGQRFWSCSTFPTCRGVREAGA